MKPIKLTHLLLAAACLTTGAAHANEIFYTTSVPARDTNLHDLLSFQQFDPALGTLTSIKIEVGSHVAGTLTLNDTSGDDRTVAASLSAALFLQRPDSSAVISVLPATLFNTGVFVAGNGSGGTSGWADLYGSVTLNGASDLSLFKGTGSVLAPLAVNANEVAAGDDLDILFATTANGYGKITYEFTAAVPEPETYGMLLLGLGVMAWVSKRKARSAQA
jgi:hypothetical protein